MPYDTVEQAEKTNSGLQKYSAKAKRGWLSSFNSCMDSGGPESKCFAVAYSVANKVDGKKAAMELLKTAKSILAGDDALRDKNEQVSSYLNRIPGVAHAAVNDWARLSEGVYEVDYHVYVDPRVGGTLTNRIKAAVNKLDRNDWIDVRGFWSPRSDRSISEVGMMGLKRFYEENPYKVTLLVRANVVQEPRRLAKSLQAREWEDLVFQAIANETSPGMAKIIFPWVKGGLIGNKFIVADVKNIRFVYKDAEDMAFTAKVYVVLPDSEKEGWKTYRWQMRGSKYRGVIS